MHILYPYRTQEEPSARDIEESFANKFFEEYLHCSRLVSFNMIRIDVAGHRFLVEANYDSYNELCVSVFDIDFDKLASLEYYSDVDEAVNDTVDKALYGVRYDTPKIAA